MKEAFKALFKKFLTIFLFLRLHNNFFLANSRTNFGLLIVLKQCDKSLHRHLSFWILFTTLKALKQLCKSFFTTNSFINIVCVFTSLTTSHRKYMLFCHRVYFLESRFLVCFTTFNINVFSL